MRFVLVAASQSGYIFHLREIDAYHSATAHSMAMDIVNLCAEDTFFSLQEFDPDGYSHALFNQVMSENSPAQRRNREFRLKYKL